MRSVTVAYIAGSLVGLVQCVPMTVALIRVLCVVGRTKTGPGCYQGMVLARFELQDALREL